MESITEPTPAAVLAKEPRLVPANEFRSVALNIANAYQRFEKEYVPIDISYDDAIARLDEIFPETLPDVTKTLTMSLFAMDEHQVKILYQLINSTNNKANIPAEYNIPDDLCRYYNYNCPFDTFPHLSVFLGEKFINDLPTVREFIASTSPNNNLIDSMLMEYALLALFLDKSEISEYRYYFMNTLLWCAESGQEHRMRYILKPILRIILIKFTKGSAVLQSFITVNKQIRNGNYCDLHGYIPGLPRKTFPAVFGYNPIDMKYPTCEIVHPQPGAELIIKENINKAKKMLKLKSEDLFNDIENIIMELIDVDFIPIMGFLDQGKYILTAFSQTQCTEFVEDLVCDSKKYSEKNSEGCSEKI